MILDVLCEEDKPLLARIAQGLRLLEDDALGGGGSRGNGRISFSALRLVWRNKDYYARGTEETVLLDNAALPALQALVAADDFAAKLA
jgi:CRISPR-associated protein Csm3